MENKIIDQNIYESRAPGKIIISGEHAVVYNSKALACAINLFTNCKIQVEENTEVKTVLKLVNLNQEFKFDIVDVHYANEFLEIFKNIKNENDLITGDINNFLKIIKTDFNESNARHFIYLFNLTISFIVFKFKLDIDNSLEIITRFLNNSLIKITISSEIPHNAGLGSSAAYNVSLATCLIDLFINVLSLTPSISNEEKKSLLITLSYKGEKFFHSKPSGIDNITSILGGLITFENFSSYSKIESSFFSEIKFYLIDTMVRRDTKTFIKKVNDFKNNYGNIFHNSINSINHVVEDLQEIIISNGDYAKFAKLIEINQSLLEIIQVSTQKISSIVNTLKENNIPSKLTGAGGGGFVLAFVRTEEEDKFLRIAEQNNFSVLECKFQIDFKNLK